MKGGVEDVCFFKFFQLRLSVGELAFQAEK